MMYLCYAKSGREFDVEAELLELGIDVYCAKRIRFVRKGKQRRPEPVIEPYMHNYIFADIPARLYLDAMAVKFLASTTYAMNRGDVKALNKFRAVVDAEYEVEDRKRQNSEAVNEYEPGQALKFIDGSFSDTVLRFRDVVERAHDMHPKVRFTFDMMGQEVTGEADPLRLKAAE